jgi:hypothetical protein
MTPMGLLLAYLAFILAMGVRYYYEREEGLLWGRRDPFWGRWEFWVCAPVFISVYAFALLYVRVFYDGLGVGKL